MIDIRTFGLCNDLKGTSDGINVDFGISTLLVDRSKGLSWCWSTVLSIAVGKIGQPIWYDNVESQVALMLCVESIAWDIGELGKLILGDNVESQVVLIFCDESIAWSVGKPIWGVNVESRVPLNSSKVLFSKNSSSSLILIISFWKRCKVSII